MVIMDTFYSPETRFLELLQNINQLHLSYLEKEESPEKIEYRIRLEDCIKEFLCIASHAQKFYIRETAEVLYRSASNKKDFSGYKAATGWNAIQLYAGNLLSQPWRKEYQQIKTYCGFYKHQIEANLVGADIMFEAMGYKHCGNGLLILDGPICPDRVTTVSRDCLIAYVECQILKTIWEEVSPSFKISWLDVLEFRRTHLCAPEHAVRALMYQYHQKQYQAQNSSDPYLNGNKYPNNLSSLLQYPTLNNGHLPVSGSHTIPPYIYNGGGCCPNNYALYGHLPYHSVPVAYPQPLMKAPYTTNGYYCTNGYVPPPVYNYTVPTGQLIEFESHNGGYDVVDRPNQKIRRSSLINQENKKSQSVKPPISEKEDEIHYEDWDYVYRNLESQGYSKDLGERGDILSPREGTRKSKPTNLDDAMHNLNVSDRPLKIVEALEKYQGEQEPRKPSERKHSESSSYENLSDVKKSTLAKVNKTKTLPLREKNSTNVKMKENSKTLESSPKNKNKWECKTCTFLNDNARDICEMCSKSKTNVEHQMEIGGPQCSKCTLVNAKDTKVCQACGASLKDSPTYI